MGDLAGTEEAELRPNATVARDGSGDFETIGEAVKAVPERSKRRFFIYVKRGEYVENVVVGKDCWNLVMYGDGSEKTVVSGNLNYVDDGLGPFDSATLSKFPAAIFKNVGFSTSLVFLGKGLVPRNALKFACHVTEKSA